MRGFDALRSLTRERVRPFDRRRSGLLLGEAAGLVLLARERDAARPAAGTPARPRQRQRRLPHRRARSAGPRPGARDPGGARRRRRRSRRPRFRERARHRDAAQRPDRDGGAPARARPAGDASAGELDQGGARAHDGRGGDAGGYHVSAGRAGWADAADGRLRGAGSGLRPGLRAGRLPRRPAAPDAQHLARLRRLQRRPRAGGHREDGRLCAGRGSIDRLGGGRGGAARRRAGRRDGASGDPADAPGARRGALPARDARVPAGRRRGPADAARCRPATGRRSRGRGPRCCSSPPRPTAPPTWSSSRGGRGPCTSRTRPRARCRPRSQSSSV